MKKKQSFDEYLKETGESSFLYACTTIDEGKFPAIPKHNHKARLNLYGNGITEDFTGAVVHSHPVKDGTVLEAAGHTHKLGTLFDTPLELEKEMKGEGSFTDYLKNRNIV